MNKFTYEGIAKWLEVFSRKTKTGKKQFVKKLPNGAFYTFTKY